MSTDTFREHHQPRVERRAARPYVGIVARATTESGFREAVDHDMPALFRWLAERGLTPGGPPFLRYLVVDEDAVPEHGPPPTTFESCVPLPAPTDLDPGTADPIRPGELPAGDWLVTLHRGGFSALPRAHAVAHDWAATEGVLVDRRPAEGGTAFAGAVEWFLIGPAEEPDPWRWETEVAYLLVDAD